MSSYSVIFLKLSRQGNKLIGFPMVESQHNIWKLLFLLDICADNEDSHSEHKSTNWTKMKFSIKDLFSKCDQIRSFLWIWSHLLKKSLMENFIFVRFTQLIIHQLLVKCRIFLKIDLTI